ncbi:MAG: ComF family protein [Anaerolineae bacterium]|nr:ComF family protein [Anaerolineae bacterium]
MSLPLLSTLAVRGLDRLYQALLDVIFPPRCVSCGQWGVSLCLQCQAAISPVPTPICERCGRPMLGRKVCPICRCDPPPLSAIRSAAVFEGSLRLAIHHLKYKGQRSLAQPLGAWMAQAWPETIQGGDCLVPVPLHRARERERGYNQARLLAEELGKRIGLSVVCDAIYRVRATQPQVHLDARSRRANVAGAFTAGPASMRGRRPVLIDDVCTTAATLSACAEVLWQSGAAQVFAYTLARAVWDPTRPEMLPDRM